MFNIHFQIFLLLQIKVQVSIRMNESKCAFKKFAFGTPPFSIETRKQLRWCVFVSILIGNNISLLLTAEVNWMHSFEDTVKTNISQELIYG